MHRERNGFSLIELLVVIFIVALVVAILFPVLFRPHQHGIRHASCQSNMKQLGLGFIQYVQDYDEKWPSGDHWAGAIYSYEKSTAVYHCPSDPTEDTTIPTYVISYAMNANLPGRTSDQLKAPSCTVLATELDGAPTCDFTKPERVSPATNGVMPNTAWGGIRLGTTSPVANPPRHDPSSMFLAADGHVKLLMPGKVSSGLDNSTSSGAQDAAHAAGTNAVDVSGSLSGKLYRLTFSEK